MRSVVSLALLLAVPAAAQAPAEPTPYQRAVAAGLTHTARPITAAAAIMIAIFASFLTADILELKQLGLALAVAVAIDAVLIRLVLVPALMRLLGGWNWWLPALRFRPPNTRAPRAAAE